MHKRTCKGKKKTCKRKIKYYKNRRKTYKGKKSRKGKGRNKKGRRILRGGQQGDFDMKGYLDLLQEFNYRVHLVGDNETHEQNYKQNFENCIFKDTIEDSEKYERKLPDALTNGIDERYTEKQTHNVSLDPYTKIDYFTTLCDSTKKFLKTKFNSFFLNETDLHHKESALSLYAREIYRKHQQFVHFTETFQKLAVNLYDNYAYKEIEGKKPEKAIMLGPIELLYPFTSSNRFAVLSVGTVFTWSQNFNFNFIMDILTDIGEFFMVIPTGNTITNLNSELSTNCNISGDIVRERATLKELLLLSELQVKTKININRLDNVLPVNHNNEGIKFINAVNIPSHYEVDHYIHKYVAFEHHGKEKHHVKEKHPGKEKHIQQDIESIVNHVIESYEHTKRGVHHQHLDCTSKAKCHNVITIEEAIVKKKEEHNDIILNPYKFHILHITRADGIKPYMDTSSLEKDNLIKVLDELPDCGTHEKHHTGTKHH